MIRNYTRSRVLRTGEPKKPGSTAMQKRKAAGVATNYALMLQIYCINKKEAEKNKELKYIKPRAGRSISAASKPSYSISAMIASFFNESLLLLKKVRPGVAIITE